MDKDTEHEAEAIARIITASLEGSRWRDLTPLSIARHLMRNGVHLDRQDAR